MHRTMKPDSTRNNRVEPLPNYPVIEREPPNRTDPGSNIPAESDLGDRGSAAVRLDFRTRRNIQRNILPDIVCDSVLSGFQRYNANVRRARENIAEATVVSTRTISDVVSTVTDEVPLRNSGSRQEELSPSIADMGQRVSNPQKPNISFAWVLRGDPNSSSSSTTTSTSSCSSSVYQNSSVSRTFTWDHTDKKHNNRQQCKSRKHHLFSEKNVKGSDLDDYRIVRKSLFETKSSRSPSYTNNNNNNNNDSLPMDLECLSLSTAETTTSISKCVDKATNLKKKRYRSKSKGSEANCLNERVPRERNVVQHVDRPGLDCDTSAFDEYLKKCSLLCPANLPMVLVSDTIMYQTRIGYQSEIFLPLGTLINGIFSVHDWIYVQLPGKVDHSGYVTASSCIPMGIIPKRHRSLHRPRQTLQTQITSKSTDNLNSLLKTHLSTQKPQQSLNGTQFEALYARVIDKLRSHHQLEESIPTATARKYSLSAQNLEKFNVLSNEALEQEAVEQKLDSVSLK